MLALCPPSVCDAGPTLKHHWLNVSCLLGSLWWWRTIQAGKAEAEENNLGGESRGRGEQSRWGKQRRRDIWPGVYDVFVKIASIQHHQIRCDHTLTQIGLGSPPPLPPPPHGRGREGGGCHEVQKKCAESLSGVIMWISLWLLVTHPSINRIIPAEVTVGDPAKPDTGTPLARRWANAANIEPAFSRR